MAKPKDFDLTFGLIPSTETGKKNIRYKVMGEVSKAGYDFLNKDPELTETLEKAREALERARPFIKLAETSNILEASYAEKLVAEALEKLG